MNIRYLSQSDLPDVARIQRECYREDMLESVDSFSAKLSAQSDFCLLAEQGGMAVGYVVALPWVYGELLDLDRFEYAVPPHADSLCIHDISVSRAARRVGTAERLLNAVLGAARSRGYQRAFLVAIQGASSYWTRHGFEVVPVGERLQRRLSAYGAGATYMARTDHVTGRSIDTHDTDK